MVSKLRVFLFYFFLSALLLVNGWGLLHGWKIEMFLIYLAPVVFFSTYVVRREKIKVPPLMTILLGVFLLTSIISTLTAVHIQNAFEYQLYYLSIILISLYVYNNVSLIRRYFILFVVGTSLLSLAYSIYIHFLGRYWYDLIPSHSEQLIYRFEGDISHYPQGVFVLLLFVPAYMCMVRKPTVLSLSAVGVSLMLLWFSYLRSAYMSVLSVALLSFPDIKQTVHKNIMIGTTVVITIGTVLFMITPLATDTHIPLISDLRGMIVSDDPSFNYKDISNGRLGFYQQALSAITERPLTGYGPDNFYYASLRYAQNVDYVVATSHSIFLDVVSEQGIIAFFVVVAVTVIVGKNIRYFRIRKNRQNATILACATALFVLFQFNYYHKLPYIFILCVSAVALLYKEKEEIYDSYITPVVAFAVGLLGLIIMIAVYLNMNGRGDMAVRLYPISTDAYRSYISVLYNTGQYEEMDRSIMYYKSLYAKVPREMEFIGNLYNLQGQPERALVFYQLALESSPRETGYVTKVYDTLQTVTSEDTARKYVEDHLQRYTILYGGMQFEDRRWFEDWCRVRDIACWKY